MATSDLIQVYVGDAIEDPAELAFLENVAKALKQSGRPAILLANFQCAGRQIDCVVATGSSSALFEIKTSVAPLRGNINGAWEREKADGNWAAYTNGYQQALSAKNRLRDEMGRFKPIESYYPSAFVVFPFGVPLGSRLTEGDFKVAVDRNDLIERWLTEHGGLTWSLDDWMAFATRLSLKRIDLADVLAGPKNEKRRETLARYMSAFADEHNVLARTWLPESEDQIASIQQDILSPHGTVIHGPSGCGKTLLAKWIACELTGRGSPCLFISAKDFSGDWRACLTREVALLTDDPVRHVLATMRAASVPAYLVLDGLNELDNAIQAQALRGLNALARKFGFRMLVTSQHVPPKSLKALASIAIAPPTLTLKRRIAEASGNRLSDAAIATLGAIDSGFEAFIVGELGDLESGGETRPRLVDQFIRARLGPFARDGSRACRRLAYELIEHLAFSISEVELDDFFCEIGVSISTVDTLFDSGLLVRRGGRVTFRHEILQRACAAFRLAQKATEDPATMGRMLSGAMHNYLAQDVLGAFESVNACIAVLKAVTDADLIAHAASGQLGAIARTAGDALLAETKRSVLEEISVARLQYAGDNGAKYIEWDPATVRYRSPEEIARLQALGLMTLRGHAVSAYLELCRAVDACISEERRRLSDLARNEGSPIKSDSFALVHGYGYGGGALGFTTIASTLQSSFGKDRLFDGPPPASLLTCTPSEAYFYLESKRRAQDFWDHGDFADQLSEFLEQRFRYEPYHLKLASLDACLGLGDIGSKRQDRLTSAIRDILENTQNWAISTQAIDILKFMGSLDDDAQEHRQVVRENINAVLEDGDIPPGDRAELALSLYIGQFDHPYSTAYCEEWNSLTDVQHKRLMRWAIKSDGLKKSLSLNWIVQEVAEFGDPADVELLRPFTLFPDTISFLSDDAMSAFCVACRALGRHGVPLPDTEPTSDGERTLAVFRRLVHQIDADALCTATEEIWDEIAAQPTQRVLGCLADVQKALNPWSPAPEEKLLGPVNIIDRYPKQCLAVSRRFVDAGQSAVSYRGERAFRGSGDALAFQIIEKHGDRSDLDRLRKANSRDDWAKYAVPAIRTLDSMTETG
tara:strand:- start:866 stop:4159 length:3294 start_codon:yes stop_codon:yes gene_type:complete